MPIVSSYEKSLRNASKPPGIDPNATGFPIMMLKRLRARTPQECREAARLLQLELDGALTGPNHAIDLAALQQHLEMCRDCGLDAATFRAIKASLAQLAPQASPEIVARLQQFATSLHQVA